MERKRIVVVDLVESSRRLPRVLAVLRHEGLGADHAVDLAMRVIARRRETVVGDDAFHLRAKRVDEIVRIRLARLQPVDHLHAILGIADRDAATLGRRAQHGRPTDVGLLDHRLARVTLASDLFLQRIEIHAAQVDPARVDLGEFSVMLGLVEREQPTVYLRHERDHAVIEDRGQSRKLGHVGHGNTRIQQHLGGAAGREQVEAERDELASKLDDTLLVEHREQSDLFSFHLLPFL